MKWGKRTAIIVAITTVALFCVGVTMEKEDGNKKKIQTFMAGLVSGEVDKTFDVFFEGSRFISEPNAVASLRDRTREAIKASGKAQSYEFIKEQKYGDSIIRFVYILKCRQIPLIWEFYFYKVTTDWALVTVTANFKGQYSLMADK